MSPALLAAFLAAAIPSFFTPGPNNLMLMASTARFGLARTIPMAVGICLGFPLMVLVIGLGLSEVFVQYPWLKSVLKYVAVANFLWMAWQLLGLRIGEAQGGDRPLGLFQAMLFQWVNPKAWAMAVSLVALVVDPGESRVLTLVFVTLGCLALSPFSSLLWMVFGRQLDRVLKRAGLERFLGAILAALMIVAVVLFLL